jgi:hypothetical protein
VKKTGKGKHYEERKTAGSNYFETCSFNFIITFLTAYFSLSNNATEVKLGSCLFVLREEILEE